MKKLILVLMSLITTYSIAALVLSISPIGLYAGAGTGKLISSYTTLDACAAAALTLSKKPADYTCKAKITVTTMPDMHGGIHVDGTKIPPPVVGYSTDRIMPSPPSDAYVPVATDVGAFRDSCAYSHMNFDDPIVYPGQSGKSHLHVFFGNTATNANSTAASIANTGSSTCGGGTANRTSYWVPAMISIMDDSPIVPLSINVYYKTGYLGVRNEDVKPFPPGLRMVTGDPTAITVIPGTGNRFTCDNGLTGWASSIPDCDSGEGHTMLMEVTFPQCWDGVNLDSPDHKSHMAFANNIWGPDRQIYSPTTGCPPDHPVALPLISYEIWYAISTVHETQTWRLSSDNYDISIPAGYSIHGDWFNGWKQDVMTTWVTNCLNKSLDCHDFILGDGRTLY